MECFVCGQRRSEASIREALRRKREEKQAQVDALIYKYSTLTSKIIYIVSIVAFLIVAGIVLILSMTNHETGDFLRAIILVLAHAWTTIKTLFTVNVVDVFHHLSGSPVLEVGTNIAALFTHVKETIMYLAHSVIPDWFDVAKENVETMGLLFARYGNQIGTAFERWRSQLAWIVANAAESLSFGRDTFVHMIEQVKNNILNLGNS